MSALEMRKEMNHTNNLVGDILTECKNRDKDKLFCVTYCDLYSICYNDEE